MHSLEIAILESFKQQPEPMTTTELVKKVMTDEFRAAEQLLNSPDKLHQKRGKSKKARLHRKILYHINKLVDERILQVAGTKGHGEKQFSLALREGDIEIRSGKKSILIRKPSRITTPIDDLTGVVPYHHEDWLHKVNAVLLEAARYDSFGEATDAMITALDSVNDVVGLLRTDLLLDAKVDAIEDALSRLERSTRDYKRQAVLVISLPKLKEESHFLKFCRCFCNFKPENISLVLNVTPKQLHERRELFLGIIPLFMKAEVKLQLKNSAAHPAPVITGNAGPYTMAAEDWRDYQSIRAESVGLCIGGASIAIDVAKTEKEQLHELARKAAEALFLVAVQRRMGFEQSLAPLRASGIRFLYISNYLRLWNYDWRTEDDTFLSELGAVDEVVREFSRMQERVYRACGMPIRFRVSLSSAFTKFGGLSQRQYRKMTVRGVSSLQAEEFLQQLRLREQLCRVFTGDRIRIFRADGIPEEILREFSFLLTFSLPFITYDFSELRGDLKLTAFIGGER